ncbi:gamma-glutamyltransferase [Rhodoferax lacus]|uniref:Gamma-glutamyltransferase n=1 Tax=Rhodoferax lacus TaxID=2184758 RepID=A0A3E1RHU3_9BURK|nr:gamma-glutamyltransferase family protein [Rhodoferax lacus]RFO98947.1 gamma-glutamyltransferase [Rhodoferax lacus]
MHPLTSPRTRWLARLAGLNRASLCGLLAVASLAGQAHAQTLAQPELPSAVVDKPGWATHTYAVAAANPLAAQAGQEILQAGGSALDAAVAVQMVLNLVEPQSSGIGGGAFMMHFDGRYTQAYDGRETAPAGATPGLFLDASGKPLEFMQAAVGGRSVGVPGALRMLYLAHLDHGRLPWKDLFAPAIRLARKGFAISPRLATLLAADEALKTDPVARAYFYDGRGQPWPEGHVLRNPELAAVLQSIAEIGPDALMQGKVAQAMVKKVQAHANPGSLALSDLAAYQPLRREPLCFDYQLRPQARTLRICGMPPPSSGTLAIGQILGLLSNTPGADQPLADGVPAAQWLHLYTEAARLAFADRAQYVADPAFTQAPAGNWSSLLAPDYLAARARLIQPDGPRIEAVQPGTPGQSRVGYAPMPAQPEYGTSHISIVDANGNALAMTTTIEAAWGSHLMVNRGLGLAGGFLLNNQLTDFSFTPQGADGAPVANRVEAGKRPRSSMSPVLVFDKQSKQLLLSAGSPGGAMIIHFTAKTLLGMIAWGLGPQQAINLPNFGTLGGPLFLEQGRFNPAVVSALQARGHTVSETPMPSGLQAIQRTPGGWLGGADPRREGLVLGD